MSAPSDAPWTVLRLLNWSKDYFVRGDVHEPRLAAEILLAHVLGCERIDLYARFDHQPDAERLKAYRDLVKRAREHEPVAYLVGYREFYSMRFHVEPAVLIPRPETEILVAQAVSQLRSLGRPGRMWDVCTGCGCVAIATAAQLKDLQALASDISPDAIEVAAGNAKAHRVADRVRCRVADLLDLPADCAELRPFDVITANAPYVPDTDEVAEEVTYEPEIALRGGPNGLTLLRPLIAAAPDLLAQGGALILEFGIDQADDVRDLISDTDAFDEPRILCDHQELERAAVAIRC